MLQELATPLVLARVQMAGTLAFHIILACFGIGLPVLMLFAEWRYLVSGSALWKALAHRWSKVFAVLFAVGAVSGTVLSFELGLLWPQFMGVFGSVISLPFTLEGVAFFLEGIFVGVYLYGWDRLPRWWHWLAGWPIAVSGFMSAWFVVTANAWMNTPRGFRMVDGKVTDVNPLAAMFTPAVWSETMHMIVAAYMVTGFCVAAYYAWRILRGHGTPYHRAALGAAFALAAVLSPIQGFVGDRAAKVVAQTQPIKLAAMEGQFNTERGAPLRIGGWPSENLRETRYAIEIPYMLSMLAYGDFNAEVVGLDAFPTDEWPPIPIVHVAFQVMVGIGSALAALAFAAAVSLAWKRRLPRGRWFLLCVVAAGPLTIIAMEAGWVVTEVGRQPWIVHGVMRTEDAVTSAPGIGYVLLATTAIYTILAIGTVTVLRVLERIPPPQEAGLGMRDQGLVNDQ
jgi:cytochrome d ubiquinol oxidase subunit I